jgi:hypothetical protein
MKLYLYRLSLKTSQQLNVFEPRKINGERYNREEWLRFIFSKTFTFQHQGNSFFFVPELPIATSIDEEVIVGWVARDRSIVERTAPWDGLALTERQSWQASLLMIDPRHHLDGQKVAFEANNYIGKPDSVIASLFKSDWGLEADGPFSINAYPIIQERSFSVFAETHHGKINQITYDVAVPNMFGSPDDFSKELGVLRDEANVSRVTTRLHSDGVINTDTSQLDEIASHVERGGGKITARTRDGQKYNSAQNAVSEDVDVDGVEPKSKTYWERIKGALDRIF